MLFKSILRAREAYETMYRLGDVVSGISSKIRFQEIVGECQWINQTDRVLGAAEGGW